MSLNVARRRRLGQVVAVAAASVASVAQASSLLEIYGTMPTGGGSVTATTYGISWRASNLEWTLGTYAHSGGTLSSGGSIPGGGIDAALTVLSPDGATVLAAHDNLSATNKDAEIHTTNVTGRTGSATIPPQSWAQSMNWKMSTPAGAALGNGQFAVVSYLPNDSSQYLDKLTLSSGATLTGIYATNTRFSAPASGTTTITDRLRLVEGSSLSVGNGNVNAANVTMENASSITISGSGFLTADYIDFGGANNDRSTISITGTGGIKAQSLDIASNTTAAVTVEQRSGLVDVQSLYFKWVNIPPTTDVSHYYLYGGTLKVQSMGLKDAILHLAGGRLESRWLLSQAVDKPNVADNSTVAWESGTIAVTGESTTALSTGGFFGSSFTLTPGKAVELNAPGLTSFVTLNGGRLALRELADNGLHMDWLSGELELTGAGTTLAAGKPLGNQLTLRSGMTLRTAGAVTVDVGSRLLLNDGGRAIVKGITNKGDIRLGGNGDSWLDTSGPTAISNTGLITGRGQITGWISNASAGRVEVSADDDLRIVGGLVSDGNVRLTGGALTVTDTYTNNAAGKFTGRGTLTGSKLDNFGVVTFAGGMSDVDVAQLQNRSKAKTIVTGAANAIFYGNVVNDAGSSFEVAADSRATFLGSVSNVNAFTGSGTKVFHGEVTGGMLASLDGDTIVEDGGSLDVAGIRESSLLVRGRAAVAAGSAVSRLEALAFSGNGSLDLRNNALVLDYAGASPMSSIRLAIAAGNLKSSSLTGDRVIALVDGASSGKTSIGGVGVDTTSLILSLALRGDADVSGTVEFSDLLVLAKHYNKPGMTWSQGDFTADGVVNFSDLLSLAKNYGGSTRSAALAAEVSGIDSAAFATDFALAQSLVPEPGMLSSFAVLTLAAAKRRRS